MPGEVRPAEPPAECASVSWYGLEGLYLTRTDKPASCKVILETGQSAYSRNRRTWSGLPVHQPGVRPGAGPVSQRPRSLRIRPRQCRSSAESTKEVPKMPQQQPKRKQQTARRRSNERPQPELWLAYDQRRSSWSKGWPKDLRQIAVSGLTSCARLQTLNPKPQTLLEWPGSPRQWRSQRPRASQPRSHDEAGNAVEGRGFRV